MIVYISIGNSDDGLSQDEWASFLVDTRDALDEPCVVQKHGEWYSLPTSSFQNACWCLELDVNDGRGIAKIRTALRDLAREYRQRAIAWAVATTDFLEATSGLALAQRRG